MVRARHQRRRRLLMHERRLDRLRLRVATKPRNRTLEKNGERVRLTQIEFSIIKYFMDNPGKALSREDKALAHHLKQPH